jgi:hypothetical protein
MWMGNCAACVAEYWEFFCWEGDFAAVFAVPSNRETSGHCAECSANCLPQCGALKQPLGWARAWRSFRSFRGFGFLGS